MTGQELAVAPFLRYLRAKLADVGALAHTPAPRPGTPTTRRS